MTAQQTAKELQRFRPATDILEKEDGFHIFMDMPGANRQTLALELNNNELVVRAATAYPEAKEKIHETEFSDGEYYRSFTLSDIVDKNKIKATFKNGVLELALPKVEKAQPRRIEIIAE